MFADIATCEGDHETAEHHLRIVCAKMETTGTGLPRHLRCRARSHALCRRSLRRGRAVRSARPRHRRREGLRRTGPVAQRAGTRIRQPQGRMRPPRCSPVRRSRSSTTPIRRTSGRGTNRPRRGIRRRRPHRRSPSCARTGARALRAQEEPGHGRPGATQAGGATRGGSRIVRGRIASCSLGRNELRHREAVHELGWRVRGDQPAVALFSLAPLPHSIRRRQQHEFVRGTHCLVILATICPQRDSNPRYGLERAATWAASRWGRLSR